MFPFRSAQFGVAGPIVSSLVNKYGCRAITIAGAIVAAIGLGFSTMAPNVATLYGTIGIVAGEFSTKFLLFYDDVQR